MTKAAKKTIQYAFAEVPATCFNQTIIYFRKPYGAAQDTHHHQPGTLSF